MLGLLSEITYALKEHTRTVTKVEESAVGPRFKITHATRRGLRCVAAATSHHLTHSPLHLFYLPVSNKSSIDSLTASSLKLLLKETPVMSRGGGSGAPVLFEKC